MVTLDMKEVGGKFYLSRDEKIMGQESDMIYLDGDGGGTIYFAVTTLYKKYWHSDVITLGSNLEDISTGKSYPIEYYVNGTTMTIYYNNVTQSMQLNVSSGNVNGYHCLKKVY